MSLFVSLTPHLHFLSPPPSSKGSAMKKRKEKKKMQSQADMQMNRFNALYSDTYCVTHFCNVMRIQLTLVTVIVYFGVGDISCISLVVWIITVLKM